MTDTIAALSSGRPPAAVAIIRTSGPLAFAAAERLTGSLPPPRHAALRTVYDPLTAEVLDQAIIVRFPGPRSATGEDIVEYQCHGGRAVVDAVMDALTSIPGVRAALPGEFTRRALASGRLDLTEAEGLADLLEAETQSQRQAALAMASGALSRQVDRWSAWIVELSARAEAAIDYVGDENETGADEVLLREEAHKFASELEDWLERPRAERLREGIRVVVAGPPNAGKSSLLNAIIGSERAIVSEVAGTTRDSIEVPVAISGVPLVFVDTAGLRVAKDPVEAIGIDRARDEIRRAEIILWLGEIGHAPSDAHVLLVRSKSDLRDEQESVAMPLDVSAKTGANLEVLLANLVDKARQLLPTEGVAALNTRQAALIGEAAGLLRAAPHDLVLQAETFRSVRLLFDRLTGRAGIEDALDSLFGRFCLGK